MATEPTAPTATEPTQPRHRPEIQELEKLMVYLRGGQWHQPRPDRWRHNELPIEVEPAYVLGEASMVVRWYRDAALPGKHTAARRYVSPFGCLDLLAVLRDLMTGQHPDLDYLPG